MGKCLFTSKPRSAPPSRASQRAAPPSGLWANASRLAAAAEPNRSEVLGRETAPSTRDPCRRLAEGPTARASLNWTRWVSGFVQDVSRRLADPYEPAKHYMRGPGPKTLEQRRNETARTP